jgi:exopolysaccharide production protein ExoQ
MRPRILRPAAQTQPAAAPSAPAPTAASRLWKKDTSGVMPVTIMVWLVIYIMIIPQGLDYAGINGMPSSSDALSKIVWLFLLGGSVGVLAWRSQRAMKLIKAQNPFLLMFLALCFASVVWSIEPAVTLRRSIRAFTVIAVCFAFTLVGWNQFRFQTLLRTILTTVMVMSIIFIAISPDFGIHSSDQPELKDAWHGITMGKNVLGSLASVCIVLWLNGYMSKQVRPAQALLWGGVAAFCLIMSRSATSIMSTVFAVMFMLILLRSPGTLRRYMPYLVGLFAIVIMIYALAVLRLVPGMEIFLKPITMFTGKDLTFTGRTGIWEVLNEHIRQRPLLGSGYGAYWVGATPTSPSFEMLTRLFFYPSEGHNGYLDVINDLGMVGGFCLLGYFWSYIRQALTLMRTDRYQGGLYLTLIFRGFLADMSESHWFLCLAVDFVIMTIATTALSRSLFDAQMNSAAAQPARKPARRW